MKGVKFMIKVGREKEIKVAKRLGGKVEKASGAIARSNDIITCPNNPLKGFSVEVKSTNRNSFSISYNLVKSVEEKALRSGKRPLIVLFLKDKCLWVVWNDDIEVTQEGDLKVYGS